MQPCPRMHEDGADASVFKIPAPKWDKDGTCSYCGSMNPEEFFAQIEAGAELGPTDKNYKVYVGEAGSHRGKFYFQHLSKEHQVRFIVLYNSGKMKIGPPGEFYVKPYFCTEMYPGKIEGSTT